MTSRFSATRLIQIRRRRGVRQEAVALAIDRSASTVRAYESGAVDPPASVVAKLATALGVHPGDLFVTDDETST